MRILVTGGCGFIGSNFIRYLLHQSAGYRVVNLDALTYAGNAANLEDLHGEPRYTFVHGDICDRVLADEVMASGIDAVVHMAAESHVDRSILDASAFVRTNVLGTQTLLDAAMWLMLQSEQSQDLVFGTGETHSVQEFLEEAFSYVNLDWRQYVTIDARYLRPTEVPLLQADPSAVKRQLGWEAQVTFRDLVRIMVDADLEDLGLPAPGKGKDRLSESRFAWLGKP